MASITVLTQPIELYDDPLPEREVLEGSPDAKLYITAESVEGDSRSGLWTCPTGKYRFFFPYEEYVYIVEGRVHIEDRFPPRRSYTLGPGDTAYFPIGAKTVWTVTEPLKKFFVACDPA